MTEDFTHVRKWLDEVGSCGSYGNWIKKSGVSPSHDISSVMMMKNVGVAISNKGSCFATLFRRGIHSPTSSK